MYFLLLFKHYNIIFIYFHKQKIFIKRDEYYNMIFKVKYLKIFIVSFFLSEAYYIVFSIHFSIILYLSFNFQ